MPIPIVENISEIDSTDDLTNNDVTTLDEQANVEVKPSSHNQIKPGLFQTALLTSEANAWIKNPEYKTSRRVNRGRKTIFILDYGSIDSTSCFVEMRGKLPVIIPNGFRMLSKHSYKYYTLHTALSESNSSNNSSKLGYVCSIFGNNPGEIEATSDWCETSTKALKIFHKDKKPYKLNGVLYFGGTDHNIQKLIINHFQLIHGEDGNGMNEGIKNCWVNHLSNKNDLESAPNKSKDIDASVKNNPKITNKNKIRIHKTNVLESALKNAQTRSWINNPNFDSESPASLSQVTVYNKRKGLWLLDYGTIDSTECIIIDKSKCQGKTNLIIPNGFRVLGYFTGQYYSLRAVISEINSSNNSGDLRYELSVFNSQTMDFDEPKIGRSAIEVAKAVFGDEKVNNGALLLGVTYKNIQDILIKHFKSVHGLAGHGMNDAVKSKWIALLSKIETNQSQSLVAPSESVVPQQENNAASAILSTPAQTTSPKNKVVVDDHINQSKNILPFKNLKTLNFTGFELKTINSHNTQLFEEQKVQNRGFFTNLPSYAMLSNQQPLAIPPWLAVHNNVTNAPAVETLDSNNKKMRLYY